MKHIAHRREISPTTSILPSNSNNALPLPINTSLTPSAPVQNIRTNAPSPESPCPMPIVQSGLSNSPETDNLIPAFTPPSFLNDLHQNAARKKPHCSPYVTLKNTKNKKRKKEIRFFRFLFFLSFLYILFYWTLTPTYWLNKNISNFFNMCHDHLF